MFDFIQKYPSEAITGGVYYALRLMMEAKMMRPQGGSSVGLKGDQATKEEVQLCNMILGEITKLEKQDALMLPEKATLKYAVSLTDILLETLKGRFDYDQVRGDDLLKELRNAHPRP